jgi:hypothetical protein
MKHDVTPPLVCAGNEQGPFDTSAMRGWLLAMGQVLLTPRLFFMQNR